MQINAAEEFIEHVKSTGKALKCAEVTLYTRYPSDDPTIISILPVVFTLDTLIMFLHRINNEYYAGHGMQQLYGTIWYTDGTWSTRGEYDGSEWWEHHEVPAVPDKLHK